MRQGSNGAQRYAPTSPLGSLPTGPGGSHWRQVSSTGPAAPAPRATMPYGAAVVGKRQQPRLLSDTLTGEPQSGEAGEGQGPMPREPEGFRYQAGAVS